MEDSEVIELWRDELKLDTWYNEFLGGQDLTNPAKFDFSTPADLIPWTEGVAGDAIGSKIQTYLTYQNGPNLWHAWDGRIHAPCSGDLIVQKVIKELHITLSKALAYIQDLVEARVAQMTDNGAEESAIKSMRAMYKDTFSKHRNFRDRLSSMAGISAMVGICKNIFDKNDSYFDNDQRYLVVRNCVFDLDSIRNSNERCFPEPINHHSSMPITRYLDVDYDPSVAEDSENPWVHFLESSLKESEDQRVVLDHLQRVTGASFMGESKLRTIVNLKGPPSSGKSIFINAIWKIGTTGSEYCTMPDSRAITKVMGTNFEQDKFKGKRFIAISEPSHREEIDDDFLKRFTGDEWVETRTLHIKSSGWVPQGALFVSSNKTLRISSTDEAIVTRVQVFEFPYRFVVNPKEEGEKEQDTTLSETLATERNKSKILNWIIEGMRMYYFGIDEEGTTDVTMKSRGVYRDARKLELPASIAVQQNKLIATGSAPRRWLLDQEEEGVLTVEAHRPPGSPAIQSNAYLDVSEAYRMFTLWCAENGERNTTAKIYFSGDLENKFETFRYAGKKKFKGLVKTNAYQINPMNTVSIDDTNVVVSPVEPKGVSMENYSFPPTF